MTVDAAVRVDTELRGTVDPRTDRQEVRVFKRRTDATAWDDDHIGTENVQTVETGSIRTTIGTDGSPVTVFEPMIFSGVVPLRGDDWIFGVQLCYEDYCSPVSSAVPGGAFEPVAKE